jgi:hypothetical protein
MTESTMWADHQPVLMSLDSIEPQTNNCSTTDKDKQLRKCAQLQTKNWVNVLRLLVCRCAVGLTPIVFARIEAKMEFWVKNCKRKKKS